MCAGVQVLIKKSYDRMRRARNRVWKLRELERERDAADTDDERSETPHSFRHTSG